jgi:hypothetical protein
MADTSFSGEMLEASRIANPNGLSVRSHVVTKVVGSKEVPVVKDGETISAPVQIVESKVVETRHVDVRDDSRDNMELDASYLAVTGKSLKVMRKTTKFDRIEATIDSIGGNSDWSELPWDVDDTEERETLYTAKLSAAVRRLNRCEDVSKWGLESVGVVPLVRRGTKEAEHMTGDELESLAVTSIASESYVTVDDSGESKVVPTMDLGARTHFRPVHWMAGDGVTFKPDVPVTVRGPAVHGIMVELPCRRAPVAKFSIARVTEDGLSGVSSKVDKIVSARKGKQHMVTRAVKMSDDIDVIMPALTSEPKLVRDIVESCGLSDKVVAKVLKAAAMHGIVKSVSLKNKATDFHVRAAYYL